MAPLDNPLDRHNLPCMLHPSPNMLYAKGYRYWFLTLNTKIDSLTLDIGMQTYKGELFSEELPL